MFATEILIFTYFSFSINEQLFVMKCESVLDTNRSYKITLTFLYNQVSLVVNDLDPLLTNLPPTVINYPWKFDAFVYLGYVPVELRRHAFFLFMLFNFN